MGQSLTQGILSGPNITLISRLMFILSEERQRLGNVDIYRQKQTPYDYFMKFRQCFPDSYLTRQFIDERKRFHALLQKNKIIVQVEATSIQRIKDLCGNNVVVDYYTKYHNFTLQNAINTKKEFNKRFQISDILYVFSNLVYAANLLQQIVGKTYLGIFRTNMVYLSTEGFIKIYPFRIAAEPPPHLVFQNPHHHKFQSQNIEVKRANDRIQLGILISKLLTLINLDQQRNLTVHDIISKLECSKSTPLSLKTILFNLITGYQVSWQQLLHILHDLRQKQKIKKQYSLKLDQDLIQKSTQLFNSSKSASQLFDKSQKQKTLVLARSNLVVSKISILSKKPSQTETNI